MIYVETNKKDKHYLINSKQGKGKYTKETCNKNQLGFDY